MSDSNELNNKKPLKQDSKETNTPKDDQEFDVQKNKEEVNFTKGGVENFKFYPDNPENHRHKYNWVHKEPSKFYDPCEESRQASLNCILRNQEDRSVCQEFFDAYKDCKKDFFKKRKEDRLKGKGGWGFW